jgi:hypothetical protein
MKHLEEKHIVACALDLGAPDWRAHLAGCDACRAAVEQARTLVRLAAAEPAPPMPEGLSARVLRALPEAPPPRFSPRPARLALAAAAALALAAALWLARPRGRSHPAPRPAPAASTRPRRRVLYLATAAHLDRTQALLVELEHAPAAPGGLVDLAPERAAARQLLASNRLYQQGARADRAPLVAGMLEALDPVLTEIEHAPARASRRQWRAMENSIAGNALLFKVRVLQQNLRTQALMTREEGSL